MTDQPGRTTRHTPAVNEVNEFLETASDFQNPLEAIREALSNSRDAGATTVTIEIRLEDGEPVIVIEDDGHGMTRDRGLPSFFDLGNSSKQDGGIGYKGHGTKIFYKSDAIRVVTAAPGGPTLEARMDEPWSKLNNGRLPEYAVREHDGGLEHGTRVEIRGFRAGHGLTPDRLTYDRIHHYLKWKTVAGSTAHFFDDDFEEMEIEVVLGDEIDDSQDRLVTDNRFTFPDEQRESGDGEYPEERMCRHYPPRRIEVEHDEGTSEVEIVGMVGGKEARNELPTWGRHAAQFGIWLAKDHIKVERINEAVAHDNEYIHFLFVANCQDLELSANRESIRNNDSPVYEAVTQEVEIFLSKVEQHPWFRKYMDVRENARTTRRAKRERDAIQSRMEAVESGDGLVPDNPFEVALALDRRADHPDVADVDLNADAEAIIRREDRLEAAGLHVELADHFRAERPLDCVDAIVCWQVGDPDELAQVQRKGYLGQDIEFELDRGSVVWGENTVDVIVVDERPQYRRLAADEDGMAVSATTPR